MVVGKYPLECCRCKSFVFGGKAIRTKEGKVYHLSCYLCWKCKCSLVGNQSVLGVDGFLFCLSCYSLCREENCAGCHKVISDTMYYYVPSRGFHMNHLVCMKCGTDTIAKEGFIEHHDYILCSTCALEVNKFTCCACERFLTGIFLERFQNRYHLFCFKCCDCNKVMGKNDYQAVGNLRNGIYKCKECFVFVPDDYPIVQVGSKEYRTKLRQYKYDNLITKVYADPVSALIKKGENFESDDNLDHPKNLLLPALSNEDSIGEDVANAVEIVPPFRYPLNKSKLKSLKACNRADMKDFAVSKLDFMFPDYLRDDMINIDCKKLKKMCKDFATDKVALAQSVNPVTPKERGNVLRRARQKMRERRYLKKLNKQEKKLEQMYYTKGDKDAKDLPTNASSSVSIVSSNSNTHCSSESEVLSFKKIINDSKRFRQENKFRSLIRQKNLSTNKRNKTGENVSNVERQKHSRNEFLSSDICSILALTNSGSSDTNFSQIDKNNLQSLKAISDLDSIDSVYNDRLNVNHSNLCRKRKKSAKSNLSVGQQVTPKQKRKSKKFSDKEIKKQKNYAKMKKYMDKFMADYVKQLSPCGILQNQNCRDNDYDKHFRLERMRKVGPEGLQRFRKQGLQTPKMKNNFDCFYDQSNDKIECSRRNVPFLDKSNCKPDRRLPYDQVDKLSNVSFLRPISPKSKDLKYTKGNFKMMLPSDDEFTPPFNPRYKKINKCDEYASIDLLDDKSLMEPCIPKSHKSQNLELDPCMPEGLLACCNISDESMTDNLADDCEPPSPPLSPHTPPPTPPLVDIKTPPAVPRKPSPPPPQPSNQQNQVTYFPGPMSFYPCAYQPQQVICPTKRKPKKNQTDKTKGNSDNFPMQKTESKGLFSVFKKSDSSTSENSKSRLKDKDIAKSSKKKSKKKVMINDGNLNVNMNNQLMSIPNYSDYYHNDDVGPSTGNVLFDGFIGHNTNNNMMCNQQELHYSSVGNPVQFAPPGSVVPMGPNANCFPGTMPFSMPSAPLLPTFIRQTAPPGPPLTLDRPTEPMMLIPPTIAAPMPPSLQQSHCQEDQTFHQDHYLRNNCTSRCSTKACDKASLIGPFNNQYPSAAACDSAGNCHAELCTISSQFPLPPFDLPGIPLLLQTTSHDLEVFLFPIPTDKVKSLRINAKSTVNGMRNNSAFARVIKSHVNNFLSVFNNFNRLSKNKKGKQKNGENDSSSSSSKKTESK